MGSCTMKSPHTAPRGKQAQPRLYFLDWLRIAAFVLLVIYHVGMYYVSWNWHVKSPDASTLLEPWMRLSSPWRMSLLFFVSGAATALMLAREGATGVWLGSRAKRLLLPLLLGVFLIVPPQSYFEVVQKHGYAEGWWGFVSLYLRGYGGFCAAEGRCLILPTWNHLWFLPYLMFYTALLWLALRWRPTMVDRLGEGLRRFTRQGPWLLMIPVLLLIVIRLALRARFPITHALVGDWFAHAMYAACFLGGAAFARAGVWERFETWRWAALGLSACSWILLITLPNSSAPGNGPGLIAVSTMQWCAIVAAVGFAHRHWNHDGAWRATLTEAVFPVYLLHQTVIILVAMALAPWQLKPWVEAPIIVATTFMLCAVAYFVSRQSSLLQPWVGMARSRQHVSATRAAASAPATR
jgi:glucans biosynthesis protein C